MKSLKALKRKLTKLCSDLVYERDKKVCQWCKRKIKSRQGAHAHHIVAKSISNPYGHYELLNLVLLCFRCHIFRLKSEVDEYIAFRDAYLAEKDFTYPQLRSLYQAVVKLKYDDYEYLLKKKELTYD